jgi:hypothetical protein
MPRKTTSKTSTGVACALATIASLRIQAESGDEAAIAALVEIGNGAAEALEAAWPHPALDAVASRSQFIPTRTTSLHSSLAPTGIWQAEHIRNLELAQPPPQTPQRRGRKDPVRDLADAFLARVHGVHGPVGIENFIGVHPVPVSVARKLKHSKDVGEWADAFILWAVSTWPQALAPTGGRGGLLAAVAQRREDEKRTYGLDQQTQLRQLAREIFRPVLK